MPRNADALRSLRAICVDAGARDDWFLDLTAEWLRRRLGELGEPDLHVELFDAGRAEIEFRYPRGLHYLFERLS